MTKGYSQSKHSVRPLSSTEEGAPGIAGHEEPSQPVAANGIVAEIDEEGNEDNVARDPNIARRPVRHTKAMILAHESNHAHCLDWCDLCRAGRGVSHRHKAFENDSGDAEFSLDYAFMTKDGKF